MNKLKQKISSLSKNKEAKTLAGNFMWLSALQVAGYVFPLITMPYLARIIGVEGFGKIAFASAIAFSCADAGQSVWDKAEKFLE